MIAKNFKTAFFSALLVLAVAYPVLGLKLTTVGIKLEGTNQVGQTQAQGAVTVYLPSRQHGPVQLPIPHPANPPYVPYEKFYRDWYQ